MLIKEDVIAGRLQLHIRHFLRSISLLILFSSASYGQLVIPSGSPKFVVDDAQFLTTEETIALQVRLQTYWSETKHAIYIRTTELKLSDDEARAKGKAMFEALTTGLDGEKSSTLIYVDRWSYTESDKFSTTQIVEYDWDDLAAQAVNPDDHYYARVPAGGTLIGYRLELKVLFNYFMDEDFSGGLNRAVDLVEQLHRGEIKSDDIGPSFFSSMLGSITFYILLIFAGILVLALVLRTLGFKGGGRTNFRGHGNPTSTPGFNGGQSSSQGGSGGGYSGGGDFGGGSSGGSFGGGATGGGGSSSDW